MGKIASAIVAVSLVANAFLLPATARAENGQIAAGVVGGLIGGALLGGALAARPAPPPPVYYAPEPVYVEEPICTFRPRARRPATKVRVVRRYARTRPWTTEGMTRA
jgi:hypothetical protein